MSDDWKSMLDELGVDAPSAISPGPSPGPSEDISLGELSMGKTDIAADNSTPRLIHQSSTTLVYRCGSDRGIKILLGNPLATQQHMARVEHEQRIFNYLPPSCPKRKVIKVDLEQADGVGRVSIHFEWVNGISLEEWLLKGRQQQQQGQPFSQEVLKTRLGIAIAIAKTLSDYHDLGVAHGSLSTSNIIVEMFEGGSIANLIHLSKSVVMKECEDEPSAKRARLEDLAGLGRVFQRLFGATLLQMAEEQKNGDEDSGDHDEACRTKRSKSSIEQEVNDGLPLYLVTLISALVKDTSGEKYENVRDVLNDLKAAVNKFDIYFRPFDWTEASLDFSAFHGRQPEKSILLNSLHSVINFGHPVMTMVSGHAGMGKSALVNQIRKTVKDRAGYMVSGKFDANGSRSDSVLFQALDSFFEMFMKEGDDQLKERMRERIDKTVGFGLGDLIQSIPSLGKLVGSDYSTNDMSTASQQMLLHRWKFLLCKLIGVISDVSLIVLVFDDLQWCDEISFDLIQTIVTDPDITQCLFVACYRDDNEILTQRVTNMLSVVKSHRVDVFPITLGPLDKEATNALISECMCLPPKLSRPLSTVVTSKTAGCPNYLVNVLRSLNQDGLIRFSLTTRRWEYQIESIKQREIPEEIVEYLTMQMSKLPQSYCLVLKLASCLGRSFDYDTFQKAEIKQGYGLETTLQLVCQVGYIEEVSPRKFVWSHDQIQQAAYDLIPENRREQFHLLIATRLLMNTPESDVNTFIFTIVGQMNKSTRLIQATEQKYEVAQLNYMAGEQALKSSSFNSAADYFTRGVKLLPEDCWEHEYPLAINLHDAAQEALFVTGDFPMLRLLSAEVIAHAKKFDDKLNSYNNLVRCLVALNQIKEAISTCTSVLSEIGMPMAQPTNEACYEAIVTTKTMLAKYPGDKMLQLPRMTDARRLAAMEFLQCILLATFNSPDPRMGVLIVSKLIQMSLEYGLCEASSFAFAMYGTMLVHGTMKDLEGGYLYGNLAIKLLNVLDGAGRFKSRVYTMVYGLINIWRDPFQASLDNLLEGYSAGCVNGDIEYAFRSTHIYSELALYTGQQLATLQNNMRIYAKRASQCKQKSSELAILPCLALANELRGDASKEDVYQVHLNTTEEDLFQLLESRNNRRECFSMLNNRKLLMIFKGDTESAIQVYELILNSPVASAEMEHIRAMPNVMGAFADGLIAFFCARKNGEDKDKWMKTGEDMIEMFKSWESISKWNFGNKLYLLEAEYYRSLGDSDRALEKYGTSIKAAREHRFVHEQGLAEEKLATYLLHQGKHIMAVEHFTNAKKCYESWGALALMRIMDEAIANC